MPSLMIMDVMVNLCDSLRADAPIRATCFYHVVLIMDFHVQLK